MDSTVFQNTLKEESGLNLFFKSVSFNVLLGYYRIAENQYFLFMLNVYYPIPSIYLFLNLF